MRLREAWCTAAAVLLCSAAFGQVDSLVHFDVQPLGSYSAVWGYTAPDGREYALLGVNGRASPPSYPGGTSIIDITDAPLVQQVAFIQGPNSSWREMKTYKHYAYIVSEGGGGVQIVNLSQLPDTAWLVRSFVHTNGSLTTSRAHSISIHDGFMYLNGCALWSPSGILIFDLRQDPENPVFVGQYQPEYIHDCYVLRDTIYAAAIYSMGGLYVADARDKGNVQTIGKITYAGSGTHNAWVTKDRRYVITTDEIGSTQKNLKIWDIGNLPTVPTSPTVTFTPTPSDIVHNVTIRGNYAYVAWYTAGIRVVSIANPAAPSDAGGFDTSPEPPGSYAGVWGVYPYFPSGNIVAGDMQNGLWVFGFSGLAPRRPVNLIEPANNDTLLEPTALQFRWTSAAAMEADPHWYRLGISGPGVQVDTVVSDSTFVLSPLVSFSSGQTYRWHIRTLDEFNDVGSPDTFAFTLATLVPPASPLPIAPVNGATQLPTTVEMRWTHIPEAGYYQLQVSLDSLFAGIILSDSAIVDTARTAVLAPGTDHFWRVRAHNIGGASAYSPVWRFRTVDAPPVAPELLAPPNQSTGVQRDPTLVWHSSAGAVSYQFQLSTDSLFAGLVTDSTITDTMFASSGLASGVTYHWRVRATGSGGTGAWSQPWVFETAATVVQEHEVMEGWNMISVSLLTDDYRVDVLYPTAASSAFAFERSVGYIPHDTLVVGVGYWLKFDSTQTVSLTGTPRPIDTVTVVAGWNLLGTISDPVAVAAIQQIPSGIIASEFFGFNGSYSAADTLGAGSSYWVKAYQDGLLIFSSPMVRDTIEAVHGVAVDPPGSQQGKLSRNMQ